MGTEALVREYGFPPWDLLVGHASCKYATHACANSISHAWVRDLIAAMRETLPAGCSPLVDVRYWAHLEPGDSPGLPHWHFDCYNAAGDPRSEGEEHRLYFAGAGCRTMFRGGFQPPEGWIVAYGHDDEHRVMPATVPGPRLLVRVSKTRIPAANVVREPPLFRGRLHC